MVHTRGRLWLVGFLSILVGCTPQVRRGEMVSASATSPAPGEAPAKHTNAPQGRSVEGRPIDCSVYGSGPGTVLILGGIHGSEPASSELVKALRHRLDLQTESITGWRVVVVPAANPDGLTSNRRTNARGVDLNRNFVAGNWSGSDRHGLESGSEPETQFLADLISRYSVTRIVSVHQPLACVDWDGPARPLAEAMAQSCGLPLRKLGAQPGSLGSYAGVDRNIATITLELPKSASKLDHATLWDRFGPALMMSARFQANRDK
jgi:murein peptide amidase A